MEARQPFAADPLTSASSSRGGACRTCNDLWFVFRAAQATGEVAQVRVGAVGAVVRGARVPCCDVLCAAPRALAVWAVQRVGSAQRRLATALTRGERHIVPEIAWKAKSCTRLGWTVAISSSTMAAADIAAHAAVTPGAAASSVAWLPCVLQRAWRSRHHQAHANERATGLPPHPGCASALAASAAQLAAESGASMRTWTGVCWPLSASQNSDHLAAAGGVSAGWRARRRQGGPVSSRITHEDWNPPAETDSVLHQQSSEPSGQPLCANEQSVQSVPAVQ
jgi:hypothetical protein